MGEFRFDKFVNGMQRGIDFAHDIASRQEALKSARRSNRAKEAVSEAIKADYTIEQEAPSEQSAALDMQTADMDLPETAKQKEADTQKSTYKRYTMKDHDAYFDALRKAASISGDPEYIKSVVDSAKDDMKESYIDYMTQALDAYDRGDFQAVSDAVSNAGNYIRNGISIRSVSNGDKLYAVGLDEDTMKPIGKPFPMDRKTILSMLGRAEKGAAGWERMNQDLRAQAQQMEEQEALAPSRLRQSKAAAGTAEMALETGELTQDAKVRMAEAQAENEAGKYSHEIKKAEIAASGRRKGEKADDKRAQVKDLNAMIDDLLLNSGDPFFTNIVNDAQGQMAFRDMTSKVLLNTGETYQPAQAIQASMRAISEGYQLMAKPDGTVFFRLPGVNTAEEAKRTDKSLAQMLGGS